MDVTTWGLPDLYWWLTAVTAVITLLGFYRTVYFFNVAYPFAVVTMATIILVAFAENLTTALALQLVLLAAWGVRLGVFALRRERRPSYAARPAGKNRDGMGVVAKVGVWLAVSLLYPMLVAPALFGPADGREPGIVGASDQWVGLAIMATGLTIEAVADYQKAAEKERAPDRFVSSGLFGWVRCPNYLGELVFWLGNVIVGAPFLVNAGRATVAILGFALLVLIMLGATKRLEAHHEATYGTNPDYRSWARRVPILFPWAPIFTFERVRLPKV